VDLLFVGTRRGLESEVVPKAGVPVEFVASRPLSRTLSIDVLRTIVQNAQGVTQALRVIRRFRPDCIVATGGYVAFPVVLAAKLLRTVRALRASIVLLEPNAAPGLANRLLSPLVDEVWKEAPVRASLLHPLDRPQARRSLGLDPDATTVVVMGGSQGARRLNDAVMQAAQRRLFPPDWQVFLIAGAREAERLRSLAAQGVSVHDYLDDPAVAYAAADIVVARAGASTLAELSATATPAVLVPYPYATHDHQMKNAKVVEAAGAARIVPDRELDAVRLVAELRAALDPEIARAMRSAARRRDGAQARQRIFERLLVLGARG
jgi:UDP-N-acetylglucosamine--N-acetylmuramyl-(pentapeptide) pyrophosphoryl-undecaprenol N-acetylglucosamine transferase